MAEAIRMPKMSDTMTEGVIASWAKKVGDKVKPGEVLAEVETDKATMELEAYEEGTLLYIGVNEKESVPVDGIIAVIGKPGEDFSALLANLSNGGVQAKPEAPVNQAPAAPAAEAAKPAASPTAKINANVIRMPKMSDTMTEGTIVSWQKKVGDKIKSGDLLAEVETDKATMELEAYEEGTLLYIGVEAGNAVAVDEIIAIIGAAGTDYTPLLSSGAAVNVANSPEPKPATVENTTLSQSSSSASATVLGNDTRVKASPLAKKLASEKGIDLTALAGTGENGRIIKKDVESASTSTAPASKKVAEQITYAAPVAEGGYEDVPVSQMRKVIARRLSESLFTAPHFYLTMEINMDKAIEARKSLIDFSGVKISFNDMVIKASAAALKKHPKVNASWLGDKIRYYKYVNIGVAVAVEEGLLVPVVRNADLLGLEKISTTVKDLGGKAKNKQLQPSDWEGNTFTISNLGMFGIEEFTAIINPPDACILAVGGIKETVAFKNGVPVPTNVMKVTLSCDHRVVDGAVGSAFLQTLKSYLEDPIRLLA